MISSIKITSLINIGANLSANSVFPVVDLSGSPVTNKTNLQSMGNVILAGAGGQEFLPAGLAILAQTVTNAAQPNITSVGTLSSLTVNGPIVSADASLGNAASANYFIGDGSLLVNVGGTGAASITNGSSNVVVAANANIAFGIGGSPNVFVISNYAASLTGNLFVTNAYVSGSVQASTVSGDGSGLSNIQGPNVTGTVPFAAVANYVDAGNVNGVVANAYAAEVAYSVDAANVSGAVANASYADVSNVSYSVDAANVNGIVANASFAAIAQAAYSVNAANVTGAVANASYADVSGVAYSVDAANVVGAVANASYADNAGSADSAGSAEVAYSVDAANVVGAVANASYADVSGVAYSVTGSNVSGEVASAAYASNANVANIANTAYSVSAANVSGLGNLALINKDGNASNILYGNGVFASSPVTYGNSNVAAYLPTYTGTLTSVGAITANGTVTANNVTSNGNAQIGSTLTVWGSNNTIGTQNGSAVQFSSRVNINGSGLGYSLVASSNISAPYYFGNGSQLTGITSSLTNLTSNISWTASNANAPTFNTSSTGTRLLLWPAANATSVDYAIGVESGSAWQSVPQATNSFGFKWYGGNTAVATLTGAGAFTANGNITTTSGTFVGNGAGLTNVTVNAAGNINGTSPNITLVAGSYSTVVDNTGNVTAPATGYLMGGTLRSTNSVGNEGGELQLAIAPASTLSGTTVSIDSYQNRVRIFEGGGNSRGVYIDLAKAPDGVGGELSYKASGVVNAGVDVTLGNLRARIPTSGNRSLQVSTISGSYTVTGSSTYSQIGTVGGATIQANSPRTINTTPAYLNPGYNFTTDGATDTWVIYDAANTIGWRITFICGYLFANNFISIERLV